MSQADQDRRIDYIEFAVENIAAAKMFYANVFGWQFTDFGPDYASFSDGRLSGGFYTASDVAHGGPLVVLYSTDLSKCRATITQHGGRVVKDIFEFPGGRRFHFVDPSGHELAVWSDQ